MKEGISGSGLKWIAIITMIIDHIAAVVLEPLYMRLVSPGLFEDAEFMSPWMMEHKGVAALALLVPLMRTIGRFSFPLYCFLLTEGFVHTRSVWKYGLNLIIFALISEIPFNLSHDGLVFNWEFQSAYLTLVLGLGCMYVLSRVETVKKEAWYRYPLLFLSVAVFSVAAIQLRTDYAAAGVLAIAAMYLLRKNKVIAFAVACVILTILSNRIEIVALFMLIPVSKYNGERGNQRFKYAFYAIYPGHFLVLYLISFLVGGLGFAVHR
ncbi:MAG: conjugal transfer protein TraX [Lachnospiraceae bacterium]|nr:conjugal transfer protein TraX [Lachnospiraceae bacterium]